MFIAAQRNYGPFQVTVKRLTAHLLLLYEILRKKTLLSTALHQLIRILVLPDKKDRKADAKL